MFAFWGADLVSLKFNMTLQVASGEAEKKDL